MQRKSLFQSCSLPQNIVSCELRWELGHPLFFYGVVDSLAERSVAVGRSAVCHGIHKFGPELIKCTEKHLCRPSVARSVGEAYISVGGARRWLASAIEAAVQMIDFRLDGRRDAKSSKTFVNKSIEQVWHHGPLTICTEVTHVSRRHDPHSDGIVHVTRKRCHAFIENDHATTKELLGDQKRLGSLQTTKATSSRLETIRTTDLGHIHNKEPGAVGEIFAAQSSGRDSVHR